MSRDLTKGSVIGNLLAMSVPTMLGMLGQTLYDVVDLFWIGRISGSAVAGVALFSSIFWLVEVLNEVIGVSSIALITQSFGAGDKARTARVIEQTIVFKSFMAVIASAFLYFALEPLVRFFTSDPEVIRSALEYGRVRTFFLPVFFATYSCFTALRCTGDPKSQMWIMLGVSVLNAILDPLFMFTEVPYLGVWGLGLGVFGAGLATVLCICVAFAIGFGLLASGRTRIRLSVRGLFRLDPAIDRKLITIGLPSGGEMLARQAAGLVTTKFVARYGTAALAALGIGGITITNLVALACVFPRSVLGFFVDSAETVAVGVPMIRFLGPSFAIVSFAIGLGCAFTGSGYNIPYLISSLAGRWVAQVPFLALSAFVLPRLGLDLGILGIWASFLVSDSVEAAVLAWHYRKGRWKGKRV